MRFDRIVRSILNEGVRLGQEGLNYRAKPEAALKALSDSYNALREYNSQGFGQLEPLARIGEMSKIMKALNTIRYVVTTSNLPEYKIHTKDGETTLSKEALVKNAIKLCANFGDKSKPAFTVPVETNDIDGHPIEVGTKINGSDYRLSLYQDTEDIRKYGGDGGLHQIYKELFPIVGLKHQVFRRREERPDDTEEGEGQRNHVIYYWGENYLPYRTVVKVNKEGKLVAATRLVANEPNPKQGAAFWKTDRMFKQDKATPLSLIGNQGAYDGTILDDKTPAEAMQILQRNDFEQIAKEAQEVIALPEEQKLALYKKQQAYNALPPEQKRDIYIKQNDPYLQAKDQRGRRRYSLNYQPQIKDGYPHFLILSKKPDGRIKVSATSAKQKFQQLYPEGEFQRELYSNR
jgi:hypothetical protein